MEIDEVFARVLRRHWLIVGVATLLPVLLVSLWLRSQPSVYVAHGRVVATSAVPKSVAEAEAVVSQVRAVATSRDVVANAVSNAHLVADPTVLARDKVVVTGLGTSPIVDIAVSSSDPRTAQRLTEALARRVTQVLDDSRIGGLPDVLRAIQDRLTDLGQKRAPLAAAAQANPKDLVAQSRLSAMDRQIEDLSVESNRLSLEAAATGHATLVDVPTVPTAPEPTDAVQKLALAALLGFAVGVLVAATIETLRPTVPGAHRVGRLLGAPLLGRAEPVVAGEETAPALVELARRVRLAARNADVRTVVVLGTQRAELPDGLVPRLERLVLALAPLTPPPSANGSVAKPASSCSVMVVDGMVSTLVEAPPQAVRTGPNRVCTLETLEPGAEAGGVGVVVLAGPVTPVSSVNSVRDLVSAAGWPVLGVAEQRRRLARPES